MPKIRIPTPLRAYTDGASDIQVAGSTVGEALGNLVEQHPDLRLHLFQDDELRSFVNIFIGDEDIRFMQGLDTEIEASDSLRIIPSIAGGMPPRSTHCIGRLHCGQPHGGQVAAASLNHWGRGALQSHPLSWMRLVGEEALR